MRDLLIITVVLVLALVAVWRPWIGVLLWTWLSLMNPHRYSWGLAYDAPLAAIAALSTLLGLVFTKDRQSPFQGTPTVLFLLFAIWVTVSWLLGVDVDGDYPQWNKVMKIYFMTFVALMLLNHKQKIIAFAWVTTASLAVLGAKGGLFTILTGGNHRVWGPPDSFVADNNDFALALVVTIPMLQFLRLQLAKSVYRHLIAIVMLLCGIAAIGSYSRGGLLAIVAMMIVLWFRSERKFLMGVVLAVAAVILLPFMPDDWWGRMGTIQTYEQDVSAMGRINAWLVAWEVAKHAFFGAGMSYQHQMFFSTYGVYEQTIRAAHSIYFQILGNHGFGGLLLFLSIWLATFRSAGWIRVQGRRVPEGKWASDLGGMAQVSLVGYAVGGAFLSLPYFDLPYNIMVTVVLARRWLESRAWEGERAITLRGVLGFQAQGKGKSAYS